MSLKERVYSVMVISASSAFGDALQALFPESGYLVCVCGDVNSAKRAMLEKSFDFVIVNASGQEDSCIRFAIDLCSARSIVPLLLVRNEVYGEIYDRVAEHGVFVLATPVSRALMAQTIPFLVSARERLRIFEKKTQTLEEKMEEIRLVNRAKWLLISKRNMPEPDAHRYLEKQAMDRCTSKREIASEVIRQYPA